MKEEFLKVLEHSKAYTLAMAQAMPEGESGLQIMGGHWKFNDLINLIAYGLIWWDAESISKKGMDWDPPQTADTKEGVLAYVNKAYDTLRTSLENMEVTDDIVRIPRTIGGRPYFTCEAGELPRRNTAIRARKQLI